MVISASVILGSVLGRFEELFSKLKQLKETFSFDIALCIGGFFANRSKEDQLDSLTQFESTSFIYTADM